MFVKFTQMSEIIFLFLLSGYVGCTLPSLAGITPYTHIREIEESSWYWTRCKLQGGAWLTFSRCGTLLFWYWVKWELALLKDRTKVGSKASLVQTKALKGCCVFKTNHKPSLVFFQSWVGSFSQVEGWSLPKIFLPFRINGNNSVMHVPLLYLVSLIGQNKILDSLNLRFGRGRGISEWMGVWSLVSNGSSGWKRSFKGLQVTVGLPHCWWWFS